MHLCPTDKPLLLADTRTVPMDCSEFICWLVGFPLSGRFEVSHCEPLKEVTNIPTPFTWSKGFIQGCYRPGNGEGKLKTVKVREFYLEFRGHYFIWHFLYFLSIFFYQSQFKVVRSEVWVSHVVWLLKHKTLSGH